VSVIAPPRKRAPKKNTVLIAIASVVAVAVIALVLANLADSGTKKKKNNATKQPTTSVPTPTAKVLKLQLGAIKVQNTGVPTKVKPSVRGALLKITQRYVDNAIMAPLETGKVNKTYTKSFDPGVKSAAARKDRAVLTEARSGAATGPVTAKATHVRLDVIGDPTGKIGLAATTFTLRIKAPTAKGVVNIRRSTELTFANEFGKWFVTAYRVSVRRSLGAKTTTNSASTVGPIETTA
jgi:hypothetical protein